MKQVNRLIFLVVFVFLLLMCAVNIYLTQKSFQNADRQYRVSINRIEKAVTVFEKEKKRAPVNLEELIQYTGMGEYSQVTGLYSIAPADHTKQDVDDFLRE